MFHLGKRKMTKEAVFGKSEKIDLSHWMDTGIFGAAALVFVIAACILISAREKKKPAD